MYSKEHEEILDIFAGYISYSKWKSYEDYVEGERSEKNNFFFIYQD